MWSNSPWTCDCTNKNENLDTAVCGGIPFEMSADLHNRGGGVGIKIFQKRFHVVRSCCRAASISSVIFGEIRFLLACSDTRLNSFAADVTVTLFSFRIILLKRSKLLCLPPRNVTQRIQRKGFACLISLRYNLRLAQNTDFCAFNWCDFNWKHLSGTRIHLRFCRCLRRLQNAFNKPTILAGGEKLTFVQDWLGLRKSSRVTG